MQESNQTRITCMDIPAGLKILNNNTKIYVRLLTSFSTNKIMEELVAAIEGQDEKGILEKSHALKGVAANLCLVDLLEVVKKIESEAKAGSLVKPEDELTTSLKEEYAKTMEAIASLIGNPDLISTYI